MKREVDQAGATVALRFTRMYLVRSMFDEIARGAWDGGSVQSRGCGAGDAVREGHSVGQESGTKQTLESQTFYLRARMPGREH